MNRMSGLSAARLVAVRNSEEIANAAMSQRRERIMAELRERQIQTTGRSGTSAGADYGPVATDLPPRRKPRRDWQADPAELDFFEVWFRAPIGRAGLLLLD